MSWKQRTIARLNRLLQRHGYQTSRALEETAPDYRENPEVGAKNFSEKLARLERGEPFEWPNIVALNKTVARFIGTAKHIVNIGAGTGSFEDFAAVDRTLELVASELDQDCVRWCRENRQRENVTYSSMDMQELLSEYGVFDLAIAVDVIEHVEDFGGFLQAFSRLADRAIVTTPNKARSHKSLTASPPTYYQHVREWTAGEFYWVLRAFYEDVELHAMPDPYVPITQRVGLQSSMTPLIAVCRKSRTP